MQGAQARSDSYVAIVMVAVDIFPVDEVGEVTHHVVAGIK